MNEQLPVDHLNRLCSMIDPRQQTWDLSPNDVDAIRWIVGELGRLRAVNAELLAACRAALDDLEEVPGRQEPTMCRILRTAIANATKE